MLELATNNNLSDDVIDVNKKNDYYVYKMKKNYCEQLTGMNLFFVINLK